MNITQGQHYDTIVIGAGMSGLAAAIRLALFDKQVLLLERHNALGGLNSFYSINGRKYDVGLHAMTNFAPGIKSAPLSKIFRQLRINPEAFDLSPQRQSKIVFNGSTLNFNNNLDFLKSQIAHQFPSQIDAFVHLSNLVNTQFESLSPDKWNNSALKFLPQFISEPLLLNMLLLPLLSYGSSKENDISWNQFVVLFKSIFLEGLARPYEGIRLVLRILKDKYKSLGGLRQMKCGVRQIISKNHKAHSLILDNGITISADHIISSIGHPETLRLCSDKSHEESHHNIGKLSFVETLTVLKDQPQSLGWNDTIIFFNDSDHLEYNCPNDFVNPNSGVICIPNNYDYNDSKELSEGLLRITALANYNLWTNLNESDYQSQKARWFNTLQNKALQYLPPIAPAQFHSITLASDMFTPKTIHKYTARLGGAVYGATHKNPSGTTHLKNLYLCGTDQGLLGVTGALMSGIAMANKHVLAKG